MSRNWNHYDRAFEEYLRHLATPYVSVNEQRRSLLADASLKSMDFIVYTPGSANLLVDIKGRRYPGGSLAQRKTCENWATREDIECLLEWETVFGEDFRAMLVFAYHVTQFDRKFADAETFEFRGRTYSFYGVWVDQYEQQMRTRSESWDTVGLPMKTFRELRIPIRRVISADGHALQPAGGPIRSPAAVTRCDRPHRSPRGTTDPVGHETVRDF